MDERMLIEKWYNPSILNVPNIEDPYVNLNNAKILEGQMDDGAYILESAHVID